MDLHIQINGIIAVLNQDVAVHGFSKKDVEFRYLLVELMHGNLALYIQLGRKLLIMDLCIKLIGGLKEQHQLFQANGLLSGLVEI